MDGWQVALLVISSVFVGMWIPVSLQLYVTLRSGRNTLETVRRRGEQTLAEASTTMVGLNATLVQMSGAMVALNRTATDLGEVAQAAARIKDTIRVVSAVAATVGPAVIALVRALREPGTETEPSSDHQAPSRTERPAPAAEKESTP